LSLFAVSRTAGWMKSVMVVRFSRSVAFVRWGF
jgi:hypothetical protein